MTPRGTSICCEGNGLEDGCGVSLKGIIGSSLPPHCFIQCHRCVVPCGFHNYFVLHRDNTSDIDHNGLRSSTRGDNIRASITSRKDVTGLMLNIIELSTSHELLHQMLYTIMTMDVISSFVVGETVITMRIKGHSTRWAEGAITQMAQETTLHLPLEHLISNAGVISPVTSGFKPIHCVEIFVVHNKCKISWCGLHLLQI